MVAPVPAQISKVFSTSTRRKHTSQTTSPVICITWRQYLSRSQQLAHTSCRHGGVPLQLQILSVSSLPPWQIPCSQQLAASLSSLCALFHTRSLCFQSFAASFDKTPGWGCLEPRTGRPFDAQNIRQRSATWTRRAHPTIIAASSRLQVYG